VGEWRIAILEKGAAGQAVAESVDEAVLSQDTRNGDARIPRADPVAHAETELVRVGWLQAVVDHVHFLTRGSGGYERLQVREPVQIGRIPGDACGGGGTRPFGDVEEDLVLGQRRLGFLQLQKIE